MKYVFRCEKLVRDRIPDLITEPGLAVVVETLDRHHHIAALKAKLKEEADEVMTAKTRDEIMEEMADVREVMEALMRMLAINHHEIDQIKRKKSLRKGGFERGIFLKTVEAPAGSELAKRFLKEPKKYPLAESSEIA